MKMIPFVLFITSLSAYGQDVWDKLEKRQGSISAKPTTSTSESKGTSVTSSGATRKSEVSTKCDQPKNSSLPLKYVKRLFQEAPTRIEVDHDPRSGSLKLSTGGMVSNCEEMLKWTMTPKKINDDQYYAVQLELVKGASCETVGTKELCTYKVSKIVDGKVVDDEMKLEPTVSGLEQCLKDTGVVTANGIDEKALVTTKSLANFSGVNETGDIVLESVGKELSNTKPVYGNFIHEEACSKYEQISETTVSVLSLEDENLDRILAEKQKVEKCGDYEKIADFIEKYKEYSDSLYPILEPLIMTAAKKAEANIVKGKYTDEDLEVLSFFDRYIAQPQIESARKSYEELQNATDDATRRAAQERLTKSLAKIVSYQKSPISTALIEKLEGKGLFDDAQKMYGLKATLFTHSKLGSGKGENRITPDVAKERADEAKQKYAEARPDKEDKYKAVTGQLDESKAELYADEANAIRQDLQQTSQSINFAMGIEAACITNPSDMSGMQRCAATYGMTCDKHCKQNGGRYCYGTFVFNKQRCVQDGQAALQDLAADLQQFTEDDTKLASEYDKKSDDWYKLEQKGRRYVAAQNGERYVEPRDTRRTRAANDDPQQYAQGQVPGYNQNMFQQQQNPYAQYQQGGQNSYLGAFAGNGQQQQMYGNGQNGYNGNMYGAFAGNNQQQNFGYNQFGNQFNNQFNNQFGANFGLQTQQYNTGFNQPYYGQQQFTQQYGQPQFNQNQMYGNNGFQQGGQQNYLGAFGAQGATNMGYWNNPAQAYGNYNMNGAYGAGQNNSYLGAFGGR